MSIIRERSDGCYLRIALRRGKIQPAPIILIEALLLDPQGS
ncbi:hypothetical protein [Paenibacillus sp. 32O-W]|nr:hypothetical protein [Paenibacillus sp. 32O-W]